MLWTMLWIDVPDPFVNLDDRSCSHVDGLCALDWTSVHRSNFGHDSPYCFRSILVIFLSDSLSFPFLVLQFTRLLILWLIPLLVDSCCFLSWSFIPKLTHPWLTNSDSIAIVLPFCTITSRDLSCSIFDLPFSVLLLSCFVIHRSLIVHRIVAAHYRIVDVADSLTLAE